MAVAYQSDGGTVFAASNSNAAITVPLPATRPVGSVLLFIGWIARTTTAVVTTAPAGYTLIHSSTGDNEGKLFVYAKEVVGGETAPTFACDGATGTSGNLWGACIFCYSGVGLGGGLAAILDGTPGRTSQAGSGSCSYPAVTISQADSMIVRFLVRREDAAVTFTPTATWNEREDVSSTVRTGGQFHLQDKLATASGVQAAVTVTPSSAVTINYLACSLALKPPTPTQTPVAEVGIENLVTPDTRTGHEIHIAGQLGNFGDQGTIRAQLFEGGTARSAVLESTPWVTTSILEYTLPIANADAAAITNYNNLSIKFWGYSSAGKASLFQVDQVFLATPAGAAAPTTPILLAATLTLTPALTPAKRLKRALAAALSLVPNLTLVQVPAFPSVSVVDNFNRANQYPPGSKWLGSTQANGLQVVSNALRNVAGSTDSIYWDVTPAVDQEAFVTLTAVPTNAYPIEIHLRRDPVANTSYYVRLSPFPGDHMISFHRRVAGVDTSLPNAISPVPFANGDALGAAMIGSTLYAFRKPAGGAWALIGARTDSTITAAGRVGLMFYGVEWIIDDFGGPAIPAPTTPVPLSVTLTVVPAISTKTTSSRTISATLTLTAAVTQLKTYKRALAAGLTLTPLLSRLRTGYRVLAATLTLGAAMTRIMTAYRAITAGLTLTAAMVARRTNKMPVPVTLTLTPVMTPKQTIPRVFNVTLTLSPAMVRRLTAYRTMAATATLSAAMTRVKSAPRTMTATLTLTPAVTQLKSFYRSLPVTLTLTPAQTRVKSAPRAFNVVLTVTPAMARLFTARRTLAVTVTMTPLMTRIFTAYRSFAATIPLTPLLTIGGQKFNRALDATLNFTAAMTRTPVRVRAFGVTLTLTPAQTRVKSAPRTMAVTLTLSPAVARVIRKTFAAALNFTAAMTKGRVNVRPVPVTLTLAPTMATKGVIGRTFSAALSLVPALTRRKTAPRAISASLTLTAAQSRRATFYRLLATPLTLNVALVRVKTKRVPLVSLLPFTATLAKSKKASLILNAPVILATQMDRLVKLTFRAVLNLVPFMNARDTSRRPPPSIPPDEIMGGLSKPQIISANGDEPQIISVGDESHYVGKK